METIFAVLLFFLDLIIALYLLILNFLLLSFIFTKIPPIPTSKEVIDSLLKIIEEKIKDKKELNTFIDLGSGFGTILIAVKKKFPKFEVIGYENWPIQFLLSKLRLLISRMKAKVIYKNLLKSDIKKADFVFCYLYSGFLNKLEEKIKKELKFKSLFMSNAFPLPNWKPSKVIVINSRNRNSNEKIYIYERKNK